MTEAKALKTGSSSEAVAVKVENLTMTYGKVIAVNDISFEIQKGKCVGLLGPNGAGKTTIIKALIGQRKTSKGNIEILGNSVKKLGHYIRREIGVLPQDNNLYGDTTVLDNLTLHGYLFGMSRKEQRQRTERLLSLASLVEKKNTRIRDLSGGMKRKITFIRTLLHDPSLLFLDEVSTGLDPQTRREMWEYINTLKNQGKTILLTTHYIEEANELADEIILLDKGKIIEQGSPTDLRRKHVGSATITLSADIEKLKMVLPSLHIKEVSSGKLRITIQKLEDISEVMNIIHNTGMQYSNLEVKLTTLEQVFLKLTGRRILE